MARSNNEGAVIERLSAEDIAEAERRSAPTSSGRTPSGGRKRIDRTEMTAPVSRAPVRVEEDKLPSGRVLRTYQMAEVE